MTDHETYDTTHDDDWSNSLYLIANSGIISNLEPTVSLSIRS